MHLLWEINKLGVQINPYLGFPSVEIDENKIISNSGDIYWKLGLLTITPKNIL